MSVAVLKELGNQIEVVFDNGSRVIAYPVSDGLWYVPTNTFELTRLVRYGNLIKCIDADDGIELAYRGVGDSLWYVGEIAIVDPPDPIKTLVDNISPGHAVTNPGGTVVSGWAWHLANNGGRGGVDWNYGMPNGVGTPIKAPGDGVVSGFDLPGVGLVIKLVLDEPAKRLHTAKEGEAAGALRAIWFQHCSTVNTGRVDQGDYVGRSGNGYGAYSPHLHVHGMIGTGNSAPASSRTDFWSFV